MGHRAGSRPSLGGRGEPELQLVPGDGGEGYGPFREPEAGAAGRLDARGVRAQPKNAHRPVRGTSSWSVGATEDSRAEER